MRVPKGQKVACVIQHQPCAPKKFVAKPKLFKLRYCINIIFVLLHQLNLFLVDVREMTYNAIDFENFLIILTIVWMYESSILLIYCENGVIKCSAIFLSHNA